MLDEVLLKVDKSIKLIRKMREHESLIASENLKFIEISDVVKKVIKIILISILLLQVKNRSLLMMQLTR